MKKLSLLAIISLISWSTFTQQWHQVSVPTSEKLNIVHFVQNSFGVGYIGGNNGVLLKTLDGGNTWNQLSYTGINEIAPYNFIDLQFVDPDIGFATFENSMGLYKTLDGGATWTQLDDPSMGAFCYRTTLHVIDENHFFVGGAGCFQSTMIFEYNNGVWSEKTDNHETFNASHFVKDIQFRANLGLATVNSDVILRSTDGGQNWYEVNTPIVDPSYHLTDLIIVNDTLVFAGHELYSGEYLFYQSNDSGATWYVAQPQGGDLIYYASWFAFEKGPDGKVYSSASQASGPHNMHIMDLNMAWSYEEVNNKILSIDSYGANYVYGVGENGYVIRNYPVLGIDELDNSAFDVFPNPSHDQITFRSKSEMELEISDAAGRLIDQKKIVNGETMDVSNWQPGFYMIRDIKSGFSKKMLVR